jgi:hypothetical protein
MNEPLQVDLFAEDQAHEEFLKVIIKRVCIEQGAGCRVRIRSARGGHGRALGEVQLFQDMLARGVAGLATPDLLVVAIDANCKPFAKAHREIAGMIRQDLFPRVAIACPDPHIERWYIADPAAVEQVVGRRPTVGRKKCLRDHYKRILRTAAEKAGVPLILDGIEFAAEIVGHMDLFKAGKTDRSLKHFLDSLRGAVAPVVTR